MFDDIDLLATRWAVMKYKCSFLTTLSGCLFTQGVGTAEDAEERHDDMRRHAHYKNKPRDLIFYDEHQYVCDGCSVCFIISICIQI